MSANLLPRQTTPSLGGQRVRLIENVESAFGEEVAITSPHALFVHTPAFLRICESAIEGCNPLPLGYVFEDGTRAYLPLVARRVANGLWMSYGSTFLSYGGPIVEREIDESRYALLVQATLDWCWNRGMYRLEFGGNPLLPQNGALLQLPRRCRAECRPGLSEAVELVADGDKLLAQCSQSRRRNIRKTEESGVTVRVAESEDDCLAFFEVYQDRRRRWGTRAKTNYQPAFFQRLYQLMCEDERIRLWLASHAGKVQAGAVVLYHGRHAQYWLGASLEDQGTWSPNAFLHFRIMEDAAARGFQRYDMGRSGSEGVRRFKLHYGATSHSADGFGIENRMAATILAGVSRARALLRSPWGSKAEREVRQA